MELEDSSGQHLEAKDLMDTMQSEHCFNIHLLLVELAIASIGATKFQDITLEVLALVEGNKVRHNLEVEQVPVMDHELHKDLD